MVPAPKMGGAAKAAPKAPPKSPPKSTGSQAPKGGYSKTPSTQKQYNWEEQLQQQVGDEAAKLEEEKAVADKQQEEIQKLQEEEKQQAGQQKQDEAQQREAQMEQKQMQMLTEEQLMQLNIEIQKEEGAVKQLESEINGHEDQKKALDMEINSKSCGPIRFMITLFVALLMEIGDLIFGLALDAAVPVGTIADMLLDVVYYFILKTLLKYHVSKFILAELIPGLDVMPWRLIGVWMSHRAQEAEVAHLKAEKKNIDAAIKNKKEQISSQKKLIKEMKAKKGEVEDESKEAKAGGGSAGSGAAASSIMQKIVRGFILAGPVLLILLTVGYGVTYAAPYVMNKAASGELSASGDDVVAGSTSTIGKITDEFSRSWRKNLQKFNKDTHVEGKVEEDTRFFGIEMLDPFFPNPKTTSQGEAVEVAYRIHGVGKRQALTSQTNCNADLRDKLSRTGVGKKAGTTKIIIDAGPSQVLIPDVIGPEIAYTEEVTCFPKFEKCGTHIVTVTSQANGIRTDARVRNRFMDALVLKEIIESEGQFQQDALSQSEVNAILKTKFPELEDFKSISDKGAVKLAIMTDRQSIIGVKKDPKTQKTRPIKLRVAVENMLNGWVRNIESVTLILPEGLQPAAQPELCTNSWEASGNILKLRSSVLSSPAFVKSLLEVDKGLQKILPSCHLEVTPGSSFETEMKENPVPVSITGSVVYAYVVQKQHTIDVRQPDGSRCNLGKGKSDTSSSSSSSSSTSSSSTTDECGKAHPNFSCKDKKADCPDGDKACLEKLGCFTGLCPGGATNVCCP